MFRRAVNVLSLVLSLSVGAGHARAQPSAERSTQDCRAGEGQVDRIYCETREVAVPLTKALRVSAPLNGSIRVHGWDKPEIRAWARVEANAPMDQEARDLARAVTTFALHDELRAEGASISPQRSWSVSYDVWVPTQTDLELTAYNGNVAVEKVNARVNAETKNGSLSMTDLAGDVRGRTANGAVNVEVEGDRWQGSGLDLTTVNGAVALTVPRNYSADLEIGTSNGDMNVDFPITLQGRITRRLTFTLGNGGPLIRVLSANGSAWFRER